MESTIDGKNPVLWFSLGLLGIVILGGLVLLYNHRHRGRFDGTTEFETERLYFAATVLTGLGIIFLESMAMYYWSPSSSNTTNNITNSNGKEIFDSCRTVIPPIATLVLGYYFGKSEQREQVRRRLE